MAQWLETLAALAQDPGLALSTDEAAPRQL